jgi:hypothetical protein
MISHKSEDRIIIDAIRELARRSLLMRWSMILRRS